MNMADRKGGVSMKGERNYLFLAPVLLLFVLPLVVDSNYILSVLIIIGLYTIVVQGLGILMGYAGQVSWPCSFLRPGCIFSGGAHYPFILAGSLCSTWSGGGAGVIAAVIGRLTLKLRELYLHMGTLGFGLLVHIGFNEAHSLTGGSPECREYLT